MNKPTQNGSVWWPNEGHILLLKAGLLPQKEAMVAWQKWLLVNQLDTSVPFSPDFLPSFFDPLDATSQHLLPFVGQHLKNASDDVYVKSLKGHLRLYWTHNHKLLFQAQEICEALQKIAIPTILLNGLAMSAAYYKNLEIKLGNGLHIAVPYQHKQQVINILKAAPFEMTLPPTERHKMSNTHFFRFLNKEKMAIHIHWNLFYEHQFEEADAIFWKNTQSFAVNDGKELSVLSPTYQFFHGMISGSWGIGSSVGWVADSVTLAKQYGVDWDKLIELSVQYQFLDFVQRALPFLKKEFAIEIPENILENLASLRSSNTENAYFRAITSPKQRTFSYYWKTNLAFYNAHLKSKPNAPKSFVLWFGKKLIKRLFAS